MKILVPTSVLQLSIVTTLEFERCDALRYRQFRTEAMIQGIVERMDLSAMCGGVMWSSMNEEIVIFPCLV